MKYIRKTKDEWYLQTYTGRQYGWEDVGAYDGFHHAKQDLAAYRHEQPCCQHRIRVRRVPIASTPATV